MKRLSILVTGGAGYVGSVLIPALIQDGHKVKCLDRFFFGDEYLKSRQFGENLELVKDDIRWFEPKILKDCLLYTSPSPRDVEESRMPSSA